MQPLFGAAAPKDGLVKDASTETFMVDVIDASHDQPVIVDFWAPWCGPCKTLGPQLEKAVKASGGKVRMVKIDIDKNQELAAQMRIQSIPAVYAFFGGRPVDGFVGALPESQVKQFVDRLAKLAGKGGAGGDPIAEALAEAKTAFAEGNVATAATLYSTILQQDPANLAALAGLGRCYVKTGDTKRARQVLDRIPEASRKDGEVQALISALDLADQAAKLAGQAGALEARLARDPNDHQARFDLAMAAFARGDRQGAVDHLLEIVKRERGWNDEAARKQLVKFFEAFGPTDPLTIAARRRLSSVLFS